MSTQVTKHFFEYDNFKFFRGNSWMLALCSYGEKKDPIGARAYLEPQAMVKREHLAGRVKFGGRAQINWTDVKEADLEANADLNFFGLGKKIATGFDYKKAKEAKLELVNFNLDEYPLQNMLNTDADGARKFLAENGNDARIVSEVWIVVDAELGEHIDANAKAGLSVSAFDSSLDITISGGKHGSQTVRYSPNTTFAYKLHKVKKWNKDKTKAEEMEADYKGLD